MQLLDKHTIQIQKGIERKIEIDEGAKLAAKIDSLRKILLTEEKRLSQYRETTVNAIQAEISELTNTISLLKNQINELELQKKNLLVPLDEKWDEVRNTEKSLEERKTHVEKQALENHSREKALNARQSALEAEKKHIESIKVSITEKLRQTEHDRKERQRELGLIQKKRENFSKERERFLRDIDRENLRIKAKEHQLNVLISSVKQRETALRRLEIRRK